MQEMPECHIHGLGFRRKENKKEVKPHTDFIHSIKENNYLGII